MSDNGQSGYTTRGGIEVQVDAVPIDPDAAIEDLVDRLDSARGVLLSSSYEYPGRYTRWDMGFVDPPVVVTSRGDMVTAEALNPRGEVLLNPVRQIMQEFEHISIFEHDVDRLVCQIERPTVRF